MENKIDKCMKEYNLYKKLRDIVELITIDRLKAVEKKRG